MIAANKAMGFGAGDIWSAATEWKNLVLAARAAAAFRGCYLEVRYEDLLRDPAAGLRAAFDFLELPTTAAQIERIVEDNRFDKVKRERKSPVPGIQSPAGHFRKGTAGGWKQDMSPLQCYRFQRIAGDLLCELGYADENWWAPSALRRVWFRALTRLGRVRGLVPRLHFGR
jgi:hypothetical protein